jgi:arylsulfatase
MQPLRGTTRSVAVLDIVVLQSSQPGTRAGMRADNRMAQEFLANDVRRRSSLAAHALVWLAVPVGEWLVGRGLHPAPALWQWAVECVAFGLLGAMQWRLAEDAWQRTLLWPSLIVVLSGLAVAGPTEPLRWQLFYLAGIVLLVTSILRDLAERVHVPVVVAALLALVAPIANRALDLHTLSGEISQGFGNISGSSSVELGFELRGAPVDPASPGPGGPPIVVISVDTLRADAVAPMESWKRLSKNGAWWKTTVSSSSWTLPAVASMQTGKTVTAHGADCVLDSGCQGLDPSVRTLAEDLSARGYTTAAFTANPWITRATGLGRGFQTYRDLAGVPPFRLTLAGPPTGPPSQDSRVVIDEAIAWLKSTNAASLYLWIHLIGPHMPYAHSANPKLQTITGEALRTGGVTGPEFRVAVKQAYDDEVIYTDREIMRLLDVLEQKGILAGGIVVLTSDHGEEFWEHGGIEHGHTHHREVTEIPLMIVAPGLASGERGGVASLVDLAPTLEDLAGLEATGLDLRKPLPPDRVATSYGNLYGGTMRSARDARERVIGSRRGLVGERWERFDLASDPGEQSPLPADPNESVYREASTIDAPIKGQAADVNKSALKSLGYVQ